MKLNNIGYLLKEGFRSIFQHGFMSFAAICVTVACLIIVGSFSALAYNLDIMVQDLNKTSEKERELYYRLIGEAKLMANVTSDWNGVSSLFEALYHGTPILVSRNRELELLIGEKDYCRFCDNDDELYSNFMSLMNGDDYNKISQAAHEFGEMYSWNKFMDKFLDRLRSL